MPAEPATGGRQAAFIESHGWWFNIDRGLLRLLALMRTDSAALGIIRWDTPWISRRLRSSAAYILGAVGVRCACAKLARALGRGTSTASLPDAGHIARFCFPRGVRLFDLEAHAITNLAGVPDAAARRRLAAVIEAQQALAARGLAPAILETGPGEDAYREELCDGVPLKTRAWWEPDMFRRVTAKARLIQAARPPASRPGSELVAELDALMERCRALPAVAAGSAPWEWLANEIETDAAGLAADDFVDEYLSHGDLARRNILVHRDNSLVFVDWQTVGDRMPDYDLYTYHFSLVQDADAGRTMSEPAVLDRLHAVLGSPPPGQAAALLRRFRLDFIRTRLQYFLLVDGVDAARRAQMLGQLRGYLECAARFERHCSNQ